MPDNNAYKCSHMNTCMPMCQGNGKGGTPQRRGSSDDIIGVRAVISSGSGVTYVKHRRTDRLLCELARAMRLFNSMSVWSKTGCDGVSDGAIHLSD